MRMNIYKKLFESAFADVPYLVFRPMLEEKLQTASIDPTTAMVDRLMEHLHHHGN
jgi:hypothetical protein